MPRPASVLSASCRQMDAPVRNLIRQSAGNLFCRQDAGSTLFCRHDEEARAGELHASQVDQR